ncbi:hypothetical protein [Clostridium drakei]|uniref:Uncharacterized protein n=1 Tax=Clostridium drakei TaxID=332101 RepID=A0A2U8DN16_9CLOT|nr:hypothetical protein [Clostridium drakei]AWI04147.1 hypothetical protein B9W14_06435 [Clostridium drakei]
MSKNVLVSLNFGGVSKIVGLPVPVDNGDVANRGYVLSEIQKAISGLDYQADVLGIQTDATLTPTTTQGARYILTDITKLHANFGVITGVENNDIVEYNGSSFVVAYDVSAKGPGVLVFNRGDSQFYKFNTSWTYGGFSTITNGTGLDNVGGTFNVKYDDITIGIDVNGKLYVKDKAITKEKLGTDVADTTKGISQNGDGSLAVKLSSDASLAFDDEGGLKFNKTVLGKVTGTIGDGSATSIDVTNTLGTKDLDVSAYDSSDNKVDCGIHVATDKITFTFDTVPAADSIKVVAIG